MIRFLKDRMSSISSDLYEEILKPIKSHTNRIIEIVPCKTALTFAECLIIKVIKSFLPNAPFALLPLKIKRLLIFSGGNTPLPDSVSFVQFKKYEKHSWRSVTFSQFACFSLQLY